jgi:hypothetical protein
MASDEERDQRVAQALIRSMDRNDPDITDSVIDKAPAGSRAELEAMRAEQYQR